MPMFTSLPVLRHIEAEVTRWQKISLSAITMPIRLWRRRKARKEPPPAKIIHHSAVTLPEDEEDETVDEANMPELVGGNSVILNDQRLKDLYKAVPRQVSVGYNYELVYATHRDGFSLLNLYGKMAEFPESPVWLLIRDNHRCLFGAYLSESIKESKNFYGSGYTFLFSWHPHFRHFHWQGDNDFYMNGQREYFSVGSGDGQFGLWLDGDLYRGRSQECKTFRNPVLTKEEDFCIVDLEVWRFTE
ncbi:oxidation resistance protein 1 [Elysia marginata]|uniref:Oxidation resistance protein 1 n=1 Tax=Elysia marginata TaxID=1093978 RepID=A0AAV4FAU9_9GAST|nr:oxidation resistance protein 1 [Elysia marginata]